MENTDQVELSQRDLSLRTHAIAVYIIMLAGMLLSGGLISIAGLIWAYVKRSDAEGSIYYSHFSNAIRTFWISILLVIIGMVTFFLGIGWIIAIVAVVYSLFKYIKGLIRVIDNKVFD